MDYISYMRNMIGSKPMFMVGAGTLIFNPDSKVLLIRRTDNGKWGIPGGSCELGESFEQAAVREAREEAGIMINSLKLFSVFSGHEMHFVYPNGDEVYNAVCIFETSDYDGDVMADGHESSDVGFFRLDDLPQNLHPPDRNIFRRYLEQQGVSK